MKTKKTINKLQNCIRYALLVFVGMCSVFWLFWLMVKLSLLPSDWLEKLL